jgi:hypothetical protein
MRRPGHGGKMQASGLLFLLALASAVVFLILRLRGCTPSGW